MDTERQSKLYELLKRGLKQVESGEELPVEWAREFFPPERREYELVYHGKETEEQILADTMAVPLQPVSVFSSNGVEWQNKLIFGDNLQAMKTLLQMKERGELLNASGTPGVRLVYIDPPFATKREFRGTQDQKAYQDKLYGAGFLEFLRRRLILLRQLLSDDGSLFVHLDWKKGHYVKVLLDEIFGENNFRNEIIWHYHDKFATGGKALDKNHDMIFHYSKTGRYIANEVRIDKAEKTRRALRKKVDGKTINILDKKGNKIYAEYTDKRIDDVWDIGRTISSKEYTGYPTQKKEELIARILRYASAEGDLVLDAFAGSGTTCAIAEKMKRRWIAIDCGKLAIYTIQKRMLNLRSNSDGDGEPLKIKPFTLYNAGLYDFETLRDLPWENWRFFALRLFECKDEPHKIGGFQMDGKRQGASVVVFNYFDKGAVSRVTISEIHTNIGKQIGSRCFIIAPKGAFMFQEDYLEFEGVRYYALRIPYSFINELHRREFSALTQPSDENAVNEAVEAVGFDFIQTPLVEYETTVKGSSAFFKIKKFESRARLKGKDKRGGFETLSAVMVDFNYDSKVFDLDKVFYAHDLQSGRWNLEFPLKDLKKKAMFVFLDIYGNEARIVIDQKQFASKVVSRERVKK